MSGPAQRSEPRDQYARPVRDLRISVTDRCNFRCGYCMPAETYGERYRFLKRSKILRFEEIARVARVFAGLGVTKLRLTGGEPLLRSKLPSLVKQLAVIDGIEDIALTTNGFLLERMAGPLVDAGLDRVTVSLDTLDPELFERLNGRGHSIEPVLAGIEAATAAGLTPLKLNCVVQRGINDGARLIELVRRFRGTGHIVRFIEFMDVGNLNGWSPTDVVTAHEILETLRPEFDFEPVVANYAGEVARRYRLTDDSAEIGIIASVSQPFCGGCTRVRLSAAGQLVTCLFATSGLDLRDILRTGASDEKLARTIRAAWRGRTDRYSEERASLRVAASEARKIEMYHIGG